MLPKILTRMIVNQHYSVGERGMIDFDLDVSVPRLLAGLVGFRIINNPVEPLTNPMR